METLIPIAQQIANTLKARGETVAISESSAGGLISAALLAVPGASYTFVTGGGNEDARSSIGQVNAQAVWGLAAALRNELGDSDIKLREVRVGMKFNRKRAERLADPRERPLSHDLGAICAGIAASDERGPQPTHMLEAKEDCDTLRERFPVADKGYPVYMSASVL